MSSPFGNATVDTNVQESPAQNSVHFAYGATGGSVDGASYVYAPPVVPVVPPLNSSEQAPEPAAYQHEGIVSASATDMAVEAVNPAVEETNPAMEEANPAVEVVNPSLVNQDNGNGSGKEVTFNSPDGVVMKRGRGRPRKYAVSEGSIVPAPSAGGVAVMQPVAQASSGKRGRGRPTGSCNKPKPVPTLVSPVSTAITGSAGAGFTPHVITVRSKENVLAKLMSYSQVNTQVVCILSANGAISSVTLQQASSGGTVTYEGQFEILTLSGSFLLSESFGQRSRTGGLSVSLAGTGGRILGGAVAGLLIAHSDVQVVLGTFLAAGQHSTKPGYNGVYSAPPTHVLPVRGSQMNYSNGGDNNGNQQTLPSLTWM